MPSWQPSATSSPLSPPAIEGERVERYSWKVMAKERRREAEGAEKREREGRDKAEDGDDEVKRSSKLDDAEAEDEEDDEACEVLPLLLLFFPMVEKTDS